MICRGSYGAITGASSAVTTSARTINPPTAPSGLRLANRASAFHGVARGFHSTRISGMACPAAVSPRASVFGDGAITLLVANPRIEQAVREVDQQVQDQDDHGEEQDDG